MIRTALWQVESFSCFTDENMASFKKLKTKSYA
jgi:hypothetical protein